MSFNLNKVQKEEIRRLTQKANRRISAAFKEYEAAGLKLVPRELTMGIQYKEQWENEKYALSRSTKFDSAKDYYNRLKVLKQFDIPDAKGGVPTLSEYKNVQSNKIRKAIVTSLGTKTVMGLPPELMEILLKQIDKMSAPDMAKFWKGFSRKAQQLKLKYSSEVAMNYAMNDFFGAEEIRPFLLDAIINVTVGPNATGEEKMKVLNEIKFFNNISLLNYLKKNENKRGK